MSNDISIIIPAYNRASYLKEALESIIQQDAVSLEVIVIDDGSTENIEDMVRSYEPLAKYVFQENKGAPAARNNGIQKSNGRFLKFLDSDDYLTPNSLQFQLSALNGSGADVCYGGWEEVGTENRNFDLPPWEMPCEDAVEALLGDWWTPPFSYLIRKELAERCLWDETLTSAQDFDFILQVAMAGARFVYVPQMTGCYRFHGGNRTSRRALPEWCANRERVLSKAERSLRRSDRLSKPRQELLAESLFRLAQVVFGFDLTWYRRLLCHVHELAPNYTPPKRLHALAVKALGFERAEKLLELRRQLRRPRR